MTVQELRTKFLEFFKEKGHKIIPSASLVPEYDPSVLFTPAGMHPLVPYLLGEPHPQGKRLVDIQKCIRTIDIEEVGDVWHLTFFEMLGNWSLGDYFKEEAIGWSWEFLTRKKWLGIDPERIYVSVFAGTKDAPRDTESAKIWQKVGLAKERIYYYSKEENWWGPVGETGPCGPDTEMYWDTGKPACGPKCEPKCDCGKYVEIWNDVFMEYERKIKDQKNPSSTPKIKMTNQNSKINKSQKYEYVPLLEKNVDTGMGLERTLAILEGKNNVYETELFEPIIKEIIRFQEDKSGKVTKETLKTLNSPIRPIRIIADHLKAATFILAAGVEPSNLERGYILRRLIRRAIRHGKLVGIKKSFTHKISEVVIDLYEETYPELRETRDFIEEQLTREEEKFNQTLERGLKELSKLFPIGKIEEIKVGREIKSFNKVDAKKAFYIYQTFGFPLEMIQEELAKRCLSVDEEEFRKEFKKHQEISRVASKGRFRGGLADFSEEVAHLHTATHLLQAALRQVLGSHVSQKGSNITRERLRFDFSHPAKLTERELKEIEKIVNQKIREKLRVTSEEMSLKEAKENGSLGLFEAKYGERVKVYSIGNYSKEICGGPHAENTGELGKFKIIKEEASSSGVRRIKAVLI